VKIIGPYVINDRVFIHTILLTFGIVDGEIPLVNDFVSTWCIGLWYVFVDGYKGEVFVKDTLRDVVVALVKYKLVENNKYMGFDHTIIQVSIKNYTLGALSV
jgi:hypothetical protein